ncbi:hypothetical protein B0H10DRAFT_1077531 [Mycena sp. CBHHK59/15]|nr:hypothetical protein B0H10DRAFT_1077531 [Mycena sp. CBHHK59/15]
MSPGSSPTRNTKYLAGGHSFIPAGKADKRSPCPALNALANHGYIPREGTYISFLHLLRAVQNVYNLTLPLALLLTLVGFLTCAKVSFKLPEPPSFSIRSRPHPGLCRGYRWRFSCSWTLDLADLSARGWTKITHDASLVHPSGTASHAPDPGLLRSLLHADITELDSAPLQENGMTLRDLATVRVTREKSLPHPLSSFHEQVAVGECALGWLVMRDADTGAIAVDTLAQWFGEERLPEGWWHSRRPSRPVGLWQARKRAGQVEVFMTQIRATDVC